MGVVNFIKRLFNKKEIVKGVRGNNVFLDFGNNEIKIALEEHRHRFKSSIEEVDNNYITIQKNAVDVDGKHYIVGNDNTPLNCSELKVDRKLGKELILYAIAYMDNNYKTLDEVNGVVDINLHMLLPLEQLPTENRFRELLKGTYNVKLNNCKNRKYRINLKRCYSEGEMVLEGFSDKELKKMKNNKIVIDIGGGTSEFFVFDSNNCRVNEFSADMGMRDLMSFYAKVTNIKNDLVMDKFLKENYPFTKEQLEKMHKEDNKFLSGLISMLNNTLLSYQNPYTTDIICVGGGSKALEYSLKKHLNKFNLIFFDSDTSTFANLEGLKNYVGKVEGNYEEEERKTEVIEEEKEIENGKCEEIHRKIEEKENIEVSENDVYNELVKEISLVENIRKMSKEWKKETVNRWDSIGGTRKELADRLHVDVRSLRNWVKEA